jgi:hypothetical protein
MSDSATLDIARENADAVARLIEQYIGGDRGEKNVQDIAKFALLLWLMIRDAWGQFQVQLDHGLEGGRALTAAASASLACDSLLRVIARLAMAVPPEDRQQVAGLSDLLAASAEVKGIQNAARDLIHRCNAPAPPLDQARLAAGLTAAANGDVEETAAIVERLKNGGEL